MQIWIAAYGPSAFSRVYDADSLYKDAALTLRSMGCEWWGEWRDPAVVDYGESLWYPWRLSLSIKCSIWRPDVRLRHEVFATEPYVALQRFESCMNILQEGNQLNLLTLQSLRQEA